MMIGVITCVILAITGIGLGIYGIVEVSKYSKINTLITKDEASAAFASFAKNLSGNERSTIVINTAHLVDKGISLPGSAYDWGSVSVSGDNHLKIVAGQEKKIFFETSNVLLAFYVEHNIINDSSKTEVHRNLGTDRYIYYINLSGDVYRIKLNDSFEPVKPEHLPKYRNIITIQNTSTGAMLIDISGTIYTISDSEF